MNRKIYLILSLLIFSGSILLLFTGNSLLVQPLFFAKSVPFGTISTWSGLIALPCIILYSIGGFHPPRSEYMRVFRLINLFIILVALSWGIVSYFLAGNWAFTFSHQAGGYAGSVAAYDAFILFTFFVAVLPFAFLFIFLLGILIKRRSKF